MKDHSRDDLKGLYQPKTARTWWLRFTHNGKQLRFSTGETDLAEAIKVARKLKADPPVAQSNDLLSEVEAFVAHRSANYKRDSLAILSAFARDMEPLKCAEIRPAHIEKWLRSLEVKERTREAYRFQLQTFFNHLIAQRKLRFNPAKDVKLNEAELGPRSTRKNWIRKKYYPALFEACTDLELKFALYCALHAGLRKEEVIMFRPEWIDRDIGQNGVIHVTFADDWHPKDCTERTIPLSPEFRDFLDNGFPRLPGRYMIAPHKVKEEGERYRVEFRTKFESFVANKAGLGHFTFHDLRRSFASNLVSAGVSVYKVADWLGDDVKVISATYGHLDPEDGELASVFGPGPSNVVPMAKADA